MHRGGDPGKHVLCFHDDRKISICNADRSADQFTALIPVFGGIIGCWVGFFLILMVSPLKALAFLILFLILQQIEGNLIYPHVVGNSVGLPAIWVLVAVTLGGNLMGIVGMLILFRWCL